MAKLKWTVDFFVDESWIADGFNPDNDDMTTMLSHRLPYAAGYEIKVKIVKRPDQNKVAKLQGYKNAKEMREDVAPL